MSPIAFVLAAALASPAPVPATVEASAIPYYHAVGATLALGGQPSAEGLARLGALGFRTVIDLRTAGEPRPAGEADTIRAQGLRYVSVPVDSSTFGAGQVAAVRAVLDDDAAAPVLLHCTTANRAAVVWALVEVQRGRPAEEAEAAAVKAGLTKPAWIEAFRRLARESAKR